MLDRRVIDRGTTYVADSVDDGARGTWSLPHVFSGMGALATALVASVAFEGTAVLGIALGCAAGWCFRSARIRTPAALTLPPTIPDPPGTWTVDFRLGQATYDEACARMLGYEPGDIEPTMASWGALVHPEDLREARRLLDDHARGDSEQYRAAVRMRHRDGHWLWVEDEGNIIERGPDGEAWRARGRHRLLSPGVTDSPQVLAVDLAKELRSLLAAVEGNLQLREWEGAVAGADEDESLRRCLARGQHLQRQLSAYAQRVAASGLAGDPAAVRDVLRFAVEAFSSWSDRPIHAAEIDAAEVVGGSKWLATAIVGLLDAIDRNSPADRPIVVETRHNEDGLVVEFRGGAANDELPAVPLMLARTLVEDAGATLRRSPGGDCVRVEVPTAMVVHPR